MEKRAIEAMAEGMCKAIDVVCVVYVEGWHKKRRRKMSRSAGNFGVYNLMRPMYDEE